MRAPAVLGCLVVLCGCASAHSGQGGTLSKQQYLSALEALPAAMRVGSTGAPIEGLAISGTITNDGATPLQCSPSEFYLVRSSGDDVPPSSQFCATPKLAPQQSTYFTATFSSPPRDDLRLRFEHGDGSYEIHDLVVPPG